MKKILNSLLIISLFILLSGCWIVPELPEPESNGVTYRGFFVGVGDYMYLDMDLGSPAPNTDKLELLFSQCRFGERETRFSIIERLVDHNATKENILNGILETFANADDNDVSYFYYMGHGGMRNGIPIITPTDYNSTFETTITVHELEEYLNMILGTKVVFLETCHAGNFIDKGIIFKPFAKSSLGLLNKEGYQVLVSSAGNEYTYDSPLGSYFCRYLIKGCKNLSADKNKDGVVDISELYQYIRLNVTKQTVQIYPDDSVFPIVEY